LIPRPEPRAETAATGQGSSTSTREATEAKKLAFIPWRDHKASAFLAKALTFWWSSSPRVIRSSACSLSRQTTVKEDGKQCKFQDRSRQAVFNEQAYKFYDIDRSAPPKKLFFKVDADNYFYTHTTWKNHFIILVDNKKDKQHLLQYTSKDLTECVLFYFQSIYFKNTRHIKNVTPHNFTLAQS
jgi:hypothetical protein